MKDRDRPWILGIGSSHNGAVCLLHGEDIVVAVQEERLLGAKRAKIQAGETSLAITYCLDYAGITAADLSAIGVCQVMLKAAHDDVRLNPLLRPDANDVPVVTVTHHLGHAAGAFAMSGFSESAVLVVDGNGSAWTHLSRDERDSVVAAQRRRFPSEDPFICETIHMASADLLPVLRLMDGRRTGYEILAAVNRRAIVCSEEAYRKLLRRLARASCIALHQSPRLRRGLGRARSTATLQPASIPSALLATDAW